jgi:RHS repeat-associated protein
MVLIPGGEFNMGSSDELPVHAVYVDSFYMSRYEITNQQYCDFLNSADVKVVSGIVYASTDSNNIYPYCDTHSIDAESQIDYSGGVFSIRTKDGRDMSNDPMVEVSWYGAVAYCNYYGYRLATEAEWEYAAHGGNHNPYYRFPWGDTISHSQANYLSDRSFSYDISPTRGYHPAYNDGIYPYTAPVGSFTANGYGLYDMTGNVWEWLNDWYSSTYYSTSPYDNPQGPSSGTHRVLRGGGWYGVARDCRVAARVHDSPDARAFGSGFRVVLDLSGPSGVPPSEEAFLGLLELLGFDKDPVNTATGNFFHSETDLSIASRGISLVFSRHYNGKDNRITPLGLGWTHSYYTILTEDTNLVSVRWSDGRTDYWNPDGLDGYEPNTVGLYDALTKDENNWIVTRKNLNKYVFDSNGLLTSMSDKNGNAITLSYNHPTDANLVTDITDSVDRTLSLGYTGGLLTSITDFALPPRSVQYSYISGRLTQVTDVLGKTIDYTYDANGYLATINDQRDVNTVINVYDPNGRVIEQTDGNGNKTIFAYDIPGPNQTTITDANGKTTIHTHITGYKLLYSIENPGGDRIYYTYDEEGNRITVTDRNSKTTYFAYDSRGNVIETTAPDGGTNIVDYNDPNFTDLPTKNTDALNNITQWKYDSNGNVTKQIDPNNNERTWTYSSFGQKLTQTDENSNTANYIYDSNGLLTEIIDPNGNHTWYGYDELWRLTHVTDGRGSSAGDPVHTTVTVYDEANRVISITRPITGESYLYDEVGNRTHVTNGRGYTTVYNYDNNNNLTRIERPAPDGQTQIIQYAYDELNRKISMTDPNENVTTYEYDDAGRLIKETNPEGDETTYSYDDHGNILSVTDGNDVTINYGYDSKNRKNHQYDELGNHWYWQYNKLGQLVKHTDATGHITRYEYDSLGRLTKIIDDANNTTEYKYDRVGNLREIKDASGKIIEKKYYDTANRMIHKEDGLDHAYEYQYDGAGNIVSEKTPNVDTKTFVYDNENRLIEVHYPDLTEVIYSYDENGNLLTVTDSTGSTTYAYDELDRLVSSTDSFSKQVQYGYDIVGNRTSITYPADSNNPARTVIYTYDKANRLDKIIDWSGRTWDYDVDGAGRIKDVNYPNGTREIRTYDQACRLASLVYKKSDGTTFISYNYTRDGQGNPVEISETGTLEPSLDLLLKEDYTYDNDNRLISSTAPTTYGYDNNGNMTSRVVGGITTTFVYDFENRLISQTTGGSNVQHIYDEQGNRIARDNNGSVTRYILDRGRSMSHVLCETDASGEIIASYIHGPQIVGRIGADGSERYYHTNHVGSVVALTDGAKVVTDRYAYTPFGIPAGSEGTASNPFTYVGSLGVMAEVDGLYFMRARFYEPSTGRFMTKDPIQGNLFKRGSMTMYTYAQNSPLKYIDPKGTTVVWTITGPWDLTADKQTLLAAHEKGWIGESEFDRSFRLSIQSIQTDSEESVKEEVKMPWGYPYTHMDLPWSIRGWADQYEQDTDLQLDLNRSRNLIHIFEVDVQGLSNFVKGGGNAGGGGGGGAE